MPTVEWLLKTLTLNPKPSEVTPETVITGYSIDTRTLKPGNLFIALPGEHVDGHAFLKQAGERGAAAFLVDQKIKQHLEYRRGIPAAVLSYLEQAKNVLYVKDPLVALETLARAKVSQNPARRIAVTGSCAKTTVKELVRCLLAQKYRVSCNEGNLNNEIGVPLSLMRADLTCDYYIAEMGASKVGDISKLCSVVAPQLGILTRISSAHLESFGSLEAIYRTKTELADYLSRTEGTLIYDVDDQTLESTLRDYTLSRVTVGIDNPAHFQAKVLEQSSDYFHFSFNGKDVFHVSKLAVLNIKNILLAMACGDACGLSFTEMDLSFKSLERPRGRFTLSRRGKQILIDDTYNANPASFLNSFNLVKEIASHGRKILVCGDMLELGPDSDQMHRLVGKQAALAGFHFVLGVGPGAKGMVEGFTSLRNTSRASAEWVSSISEAAMVLKKVLRPDDLVLFKGSRGMHLEKLMEKVQEFTSERISVMGEQTDQRSIY